MPACDDRVRAEPLQGERRLGLRAGVGEGLAQQAQVEARREAKSRSQQAEFAERGDERAVDAARFALLGERAQPFGGQARAAPRTTAALCRLQSENAGHAGAPCIYREPLTAVTTRYARGGYQPDGPTKGAIRYGRRSAPRLSLAHIDTFARDHLPPPDQWPELVFDLPELHYPERLNCGAELLDRTVERLGPDRPAFRLAVRRGLDVRGAAASGSTGSRMS